MTNTATLAAALTNLSQLNRTFPAAFSAARAEVASLTRQTLVELTGIRVSPAHDKLISGDVTVAVEMINEGDSAEGVAAEMIERLREELAL